MVTQIEIFKTDVQQASEAVKMAGLLMQQLPHCLINFDLDDCDRILRVESGEAINIQQIIHLMTVQGYACKRLI